MFQKFNQGSIMICVLRAKHQCRPIKVKTEFDYQGVLVQVFCQSHRGWFWRLNYKNITLNSAGFSGLAQLDEAIDEARQEIDFDLFLDYALDLAQRSHFKLTRKYRRCATIN
jgi:hypothetical protein